MITRTTVHTPKGDITQTAKVFEDVHTRCEVPPDGDIHLSEVKKYVRFIETARRLGQY